MKLSFATLGCPDWTLEQVLNNGKAMGYDGVELRGDADEHVGADFTKAQTAELKKKFDDAGLQVACIMGYTRFTWQDAAKRQEAVDHSIKFLQVAKDLQCPTFRIFAGQYDGGGFEDNLDRAIEAIRKVAPVAEDCGVKLALETHDDWCVGKNLKAILDGVDSPAMGVCWDMANAFFVEPYEETFPYIKDCIYHVHFKDAEVNEAGKHLSIIPCEGEVDMIGGLKLLHEANYDGWLSFEWEKKWQPNLAEPEVAFPRYMQETTRMMAQVGVTRG